MTTETLGQKGGDVRFRLRSATDALHRQTEEIFALNRRMATREGYRGLLGGIYGFYRPAEAALSQISWPAAMQMHDRLEKSAWLKNDLEALHVEIDALPLCHTVPQPASVADGLGMLYVMEGATLGGQIIKRELFERLSIAPESGGRFFASYEKRIGPMWRLFVAELDRHAAALPAMEACALATFTSFGDWLRLLDVP